MKKGTKIGIRAAIAVVLVTSFFLFINKNVFLNSLEEISSNVQEERIGAVTTREARATGIQWTFGPTLGNARDKLWGRTYECYGENADIVTKLGAAYVRGLQGEAGTDEFLDADHILATAKHYISEGYAITTGYSR